MEQDGLIDDQSADVAMMSFSLPFYLETQYLPGGNMEGDGTLAPGTYRQGDLLIQYTGDTLTFTDGSVAYELGDGIGPHQRQFPAPPRFHQALRVPPQHRRLKKRTQIWSDHC